MFKRGNWIINIWSFWTSLARAICKHPLITMLGRKRSNIAQGLNYHPGALSWQSKQKCQLPAESVCILGLTSSEWANGRKGKLIFMFQLFSFRHTFPALQTHDTQDFREHFIISVRIFGQWYSGSALIWKRKQSNYFQKCEKNMLRTTPTDQTFVAISGFRLNRVVSLTLLLR